MIIVVYSFSLHSLQYLSFFFHPFSIKSQVYSCLFLHFEYINCFFEIELFIRMSFLNWFNSWCIMEDMLVGLVFKIRRSKHAICYWVVVRRSYRPLDLSSIFKTIRSTTCRVVMFRSTIFVYPHASATWQPLLLFSDERCQHRKTYTDGSVFVAAANHA